MGLWLVQECRRAWERVGMTLQLRSADAVGGKGAAVRQRGKSQRRFVPPAGQHAGGVGRVLPTDEPAGACRSRSDSALRLEGLALCYRWVLERLEGLTGKRLETIHIVGGGCQNVLLNQLTADACDRPVVAGPVEATAIGNVLTQAIGLGVLGSLADAREVVRRSFEVHAFEPRNADAWHEPYARFQKLRGGS